MIFKSYLIEQNNNLNNKNILLFYGENVGLKNEFKNKIKLKNKNSEIVRFNQEEIIKEEEKFVNEIFNISLFDKKKIYFIESSSDKILEVFKNIEDKLSDQKIYLFAELLDKKSKLRNYFEKSSNIGAVACYADNEISIKKIILDKLKGFEGLSPQNINMIIENTSLDRVRLDNELDKIITYFTNKKINTDSLELLLDIRVNDSFNLLKDEALCGNKIKTNKLLSNTVMDDDKNIFYLNIINQRMNKLIETSELVKNLSLENAVNTIKPPIFWKDKPMFMMQAKKWNKNKIKNVLKKTYDLEIKIKSNSIINKNILVKKLLIDVCELANTSIVN
jgi:DNA polymerase III subunit delta